MRRAIGGGLFAVMTCLAIAACSARTAFVPQSGSLGSTAFTSAATPFYARLMAAPKRRLCPEAAFGEFQCDGIVNELELGPDARSCLHLPGCYAPADLQAAYNIVKQAATRGKGKTVALIDAYGYRQVARDLAAYRAYFGLPKCGAGCFRVIGQNGGAPPATQDSGWDFEQAIDVDMVSAICPNCHILLVEANTNKLTDFTAALETAIGMADVVSNSWGGPEAYSSGGPFDNHPGVVVTASSGDSGAGSNFFGQQATAQEPCAFVGVVCVGGTSLIFQGGKRVKEVVWDDLIQHRCNTGPCATGSGCSSLVNKPLWQYDKGCPGRSESDISADADPKTGVVVAFEKKYYSAGGTSVSSPMIAAMIALAGNTKLAGPAYIWNTAAHTRSAFYAITSGFNENATFRTFVCDTTMLYICQAGTHMNGTYSGPTGWGVPNGLRAL